MTRDADFKRLVRRVAAETGQRYTAVREAVVADNQPSRVLSRRAFGLKTFYRVRPVGAWPAGATADALGDALFNRVVRWGGRHANVFLDNGSRLHQCPTPDGRAGEYFAVAGPECDRAADVVAWDRAADSTADRLAESAEAELDVGDDARISIARTRSSESYLASAAVDASAYSSVLAPFLESRWVACGAVRSAAPTWRFDEQPYADSAHSRRLLVVDHATTVQVSTFLKVATTDLMLRAAEHGVHPVGRAGPGDVVSAIAVQRRCAEAVARVLTPDDDAARSGLDMWHAVLDAIAANTDEASQLVEWIGVEASSLPRDLVAEARRILKSGSDHAFDGRVGEVISDADADRALNAAPLTTRAALRAAFISACKERRRDYTVDWVHLKLNDTANRTVRCYDPLDPNLSGRSA